MHISKKLNIRTRAVIFYLALMMIPAVSFAQRSNASGDFPIYANNNKPDLVMDRQRFVAQMEIVDRYFDPGDCAIAENAVRASGYRRLVRFDTVIMNRGDGDLVVGDRSDPNNPYAEYFVFHQCHGHYHIRDFSIYELVALDGTTVVAGSKLGFCFEDSFKYEDAGKSHGYDCQNNGITSAWGDWYYKQLVGQYIDITGIPEGDYYVRVTLNKPLDPTKKKGSQGIFDEGQNRYPNVYQVLIHVPDPRNKVALVTD